MKWRRRTRGLPVNAVKQICLAVMISSGIATGQGTSARAAYPYLLRVEHSNFGGHSCALLQNTGAFHLELSHGEDVKVFEGTIEANQLLELEHALGVTVLADLSQQQIEEPLIRTQHDELQVTIFRGDGWQDLLFRSSDSQRPFARYLQPLERWLENLHKLPHRELGEDEGKNNCLPPRVVALKKRGDALPDTPSSKTTSRILSSGPAPQSPQPSRQPARPQRIPALLRMYSLEMKSDSAQESCAVIGETGTYRFEERTQRSGKPVNNKIVAGQIAVEELQQLRQLLDDPALAKFKHHEPPGGMVISMMGDLLNLSISRPNGIQQFVLSSQFNHPGFASFYRGDGDVSSARVLLKFLSEHVENNAAGVRDPSARNGCTEAP